MLKSLFTKFCSLLHQIFLTTVRCVSHLISTNYMTLQKKTACAKTGIFQDVLKLPGNSVLKVEKKDVMWL